MEHNTLASPSRHVVLGWVGVLGKGGGAGGGRGWAMYARIAACTVRSIPHLGRADGVVRLHDLLRPVRDRAGRPRRHREQEDWHEHDGALDGADRKKDESPHQHPQAQQGAEVGAGLQQRRKALVGLHFFGRGWWVGWGCVYSWPSRLTRGYAVVGPRRAAAAAQAPMCFLAHVRCRSTLLLSCGFRARRTANVEAAAQIRRRKQWWPDYRWWLRRVAVFVCPGGRWVGWAPHPGQVRGSCSPTAVLLYGTFTFLSCLSADRRFRSSAGCVAGQRAAAAPFQC